MSATLAMLADVPVFSLLDRDERATLAALLESENYRKGQTIFREGDAGDSLYVVLSGQVQVFTENTQGEKIVLSENENSDVFGEISMLDGGPRTATAVAVEDSELLRLDREGLQQLVSDHPHAALDLLAVMGHRLRRTDELLRTHVSRNANMEEQERLTLGNRIADRVAAFGGSWTFIILFALVIFVWMCINSRYFNRTPFDAYPFILLNLVLSTVAAVQAPVIMMSQNRQSAKDRLKSDLDYEVNLKAELEVAQLHHKIDRVYETMQEHWSQRTKEKRVEDRIENPGRRSNDYY